MINLLSKKKPLPQHKRTVKCHKESFLKRWQNERFLNIYWYKKKGEITKRSREKKTRLKCYNFRFHCLATFPKKRTCYFKFFGQLFSTNQKKLYQERNSINNTTLHNFHPMLFLNRKSEQVVGELRPSNRGNLQGFCVGYFFLVL